MPSPTRPVRRAVAPSVFASVLCIALPLAQAQTFGEGNGKLLLTGGVTSIDGVAGGGLTPWAVTTGYGSQGQWSATGFGTRVGTLTICVVG